MHHGYAYFHHKITDSFLMNLIFMHIDPKDDLILLRPVLVRTTAMANYLQTMRCSFTQGIRINMV